MLGLSNGVNPSMFQTENFFFLNNFYWHYNDDTAKNTAQEYFFPFTMVYKGIKYPTAEHTYQSTKAITVDRADLVDEILQNSSAFKAKSVGARANTEHNYHTRRDGMLDAMRGILWKKHRQCPPFRHALATTGSQPLAHPVISKFWGEFASAESMCNGIQDGLN